MSTQPLYHTEFRNSPDGRVIRITHFPKGYRLESLKGKIMFYKKDKGLKLLNLSPKGKVDEKAFTKLLMKIVKLIRYGKLK